MTPADDARGTQTLASLDALLRALDDQIAAVELPEIPKPSGRAGDPSPVIESLLAQVEQLCTQRAVSMREQHRWSVEAERAIRVNDDMRAKDALARHAEHNRLAREAEALLAEFRSLITDVRTSLVRSASGNAG